MTNWKLFTVRSISSFFVLVLILFNFQTGCKKKNAQSATEFVIHSKLLKNAGLLPKLKKKNGRISACLDTQNNDAVFENLKYVTNAWNIALAPYEDWGISEIFVDQECADNGVKLTIKTLSPKECLKFAGLGDNVSLTIWLCADLQRYTALLLHEYGHMIRGIYNEASDMPSVMNSGGILYPRLTADDYAAIRHAWINRELPMSRMECPYGFSVVAKEAYGFACREDLKKTTSSLVAWSAYRSLENILFQSRVDSKIKIALYNLSCSDSACSFEIDGPAWKEFVQLPWIRALGNKAISLTSPQGYNRAAIVNPHCLTTEYVTATRRNRLSFGDPKAAPAGVQILCHEFGFSLRIALTLLAKEQNIPETSFLNGAYAIKPLMVEVF